MIDGADGHRMARCNRRHNDNLFGAADRLPDQERRRERGAFFGSIQKTLGQLLWADRIGMSRLTDLAGPAGVIAESTALDPDREGRKGEREACDHVIIGCVDGVGETGHWPLIEAGTRPADTGLPLMPE